MSNAHITQDFQLSSIHNHNIDVKNREVYLHSRIDCEEESGVEFSCSVIFQKNIRYLNTINSEPILIHMHMPGGVWEDCLSIYDTIKFSNPKSQYWPMQKLNLQAVLYSKRHTEEY